MKKLIIVVILFLQGCSILATKEAAIGCQVADIVSTKYALTNPLAYETSPIPLPALLLVKLGIIYFIYKWEGWNSSPELARAAVTVVGCAPVFNNMAIGARGPGPTVWK